MRSDDGGIQSPFGMVESMRQMLPCRYQRNDDSPLFFIEIVSILLISGSGDRFSAPRFMRPRALPKTGGVHTKE